MRLDLHESPRVRSFRESVSQSLKGKNIRRSLGLHCNKTIVTLKMRVLHFNVASKFFSLRSHFILETKLYTFAETIVCIRKGHEMFYSLFGCPDRSFYLKRANPYLPMPYEIC